jgi:hypothetical protein
MLVEDSHVPKSKKIQRPSGLSPKLAQEWKEQFGINEQVMEELQNTAMPKLQQGTSVNKPTIEKPSSTPKQKKERTGTFDAPTLPADILEEARRLLEG